MARNSRRDTILKQIGDAFIPEIDRNNNKCLALLKLNWSDHL